MEKLNSEQIHLIGVQARNAEHHGRLLLEQQEPGCVEAFNEALELCRRIGDRATEAIITLKLGNAYLTVPGLRNLDEAERWYRLSLNRREQSDVIGRARCIGQLGTVNYERFIEAREAGRTDAEVLAHLRAALIAHQQSLDLFPAEAVNELAVAHNQLGLIYRDGGQIDAALHHYQEAIRYDEAAGNLYGAAQTRGNMAVVLALSGRFHDALLWAQAALRDFETQGGSAAVISKTNELITWINQGIAGRQT
jgi:tetratricopeptide (TPR) repeat protein